MASHKVARQPCFSEEPATLSETDYGPWVGQSNVQADVHH